MANTYELISSTRLTATANIVSFTSIPQTFRDLQVRINARHFQGNSGSPIYLNMNGDSTEANYANVYWDFQGNPTNTGRGASRYMSQVTDGSTTAGSFSYWKMYIPNYTSTTINKISTYTAYYGTNTSNSFTYANDGVILALSNAAVTSLEFPAFNFATQYFAIDSLFELYGIKNS